HDPRNTGKPDGQDSLVVSLRLHPGRQRRGRAGRPRAGRATRAALSHLPLMAAGLFKRHGRLAQRALRISGVLTCAVACVTLIADASARTTPSKATLTIGDGQSACGSVNPQNASSYVPEIMLAYEPFMHRLPNGSIGPGLATAWR